jgi:hypothetical protein
MKNLLLLISLILLSAVLLAQTAAAPAAGDGTSSNPYQIATLENLYWIAANNDVVPIPEQTVRFAAHYVQTADIDAAITSNWFAGEGWMPIGNQTDHFTGHYDGNGKTISNMAINRSSADYQGIFGFASAAAIENLGVIDFDFVTQDLSGGLAGHIENESTVENCYSTGVIHAASVAGGLVGSCDGSSIASSHSTATVTGSSEKIGGLAGQLVAEGFIENCSAAGNVSGADRVGGFVGVNFTGSIHTCYALGNVSGNNAVGGFVGVNQGMGGAIQNCYATGYVMGNNYVGGFAGENFHGIIIGQSFSLGDVYGNNTVGGFAGRLTNNPGGGWYPLTELKNCFSRGNVFGNDNVGGFIGNSTVLETYLTNCLATGYVQGATDKTGGFAGSITTGATTVTSCYWNTETSNQPTSAAGFGRTTEQLTYPYTNAYSGWNFSSIWKADEFYQFNGGYPYQLYQENIVSAPSVITLMVDANTETSSTGGGYVLAENGGNAIERGLLVSLEQPPTWENFDQKITDAGAGIGEFTASIEGLLPAAVYYARAYAINTNGIGYGSPFEFTPLGKAVIEAESISNMTTNGAQVNGIIHFTGFPPAFQHGVCFNTSGNPTVNDDKTELGPILQKGQFFSVLEDLQPITTYYAKIYHIVESGTFYGEEFVFTTHTPAIEPEGEGIEGNPYLIANLGNLKWISENSSQWDKHYLQTANIDVAETATWSSTAGWMPVGNSSVKFTGVYDGGAHSISNLHINRPSDNNQGLFGYTQNALIKNLKLEQSNIQGNSAVGGLIGYAANTHVFNSSSSGNIHGATDVGGLIGRAYPANIYYSYSEGSIEGANNVGGMAGYLHGSVIADCYTRAEVAGLEDIGGLVGFANVSNTISRSYSTGAVEGAGSHIGGLIGRVWSGSPATNCYWDMETSGQTSSAGGVGAVGKTTAEMQNQGTYRNYNFDRAWQMGTRNGYPLFRDLTVYDELTELELSDLTGSGTAESPYIITNANELNAMRLDLTAWYELGNDIDLTSSLVWNHGLGFAPIGASTSGQRFAGSFNGKDFTITGLVINRPNLSYQALFGYAEGAVIENLKLEETNIVGFDYLSHLIGMANSETNVSNVHASGMISGRNYLGGLIGHAIGGTSVFYSFSNSAILGNNDVGGLIGRAYPAIIYYSYSEGSIEGANNVGGMAGYLHGSVIADCYSRAELAGLEDIGGLVGFANVSNTISRSYSTGAVEGAGSHIGGLIGRVWSGSPATNCYWDMETSGQTSSAGGTGAVGKTTAEMQTQSTYRNYNFDRAWQMGTRNGYPLFRDLTVYDELTELELSDLTGSGTAESPYIITNANELNAMRLDLTAWYELGNDIDLTSSLIWNRGSGFAPIGASTSGQRFAGSFNGKDFTITGLVINRPNLSYQALFGYAEGAVIENLKLEETNIVGFDYLSHLIGMTNSETNVSNVHAYGMISGRNYLGGLIGHAIGGTTVFYSFSNSAILGNNDVGGLIGRAYPATINYSYSEGSIEGATSVGGMAGYLRSSVIADCYSKADVTGVGELGGLVGYANVSNAISRSYSTGAIEGAGSHIGGFIGRVWSGSPATNCYWDMETSGQTSSAGGSGAMGRSTDEMTHPYASNTFSGWSFTNIWKADEQYNMNDGYPFLSWQKANHTLALPTGWSGLSSYVVPVQPAMEDVFASISDELIIVQTLTGMYYPGQNINHIGNWESHSAYKVKTNAACMLEITGEYETNMAVQLNAGWNLLPVVTPDGANAANLLSPVNGFVIAKDIAGTGVFWPQYNINSIGNIFPGKAYFVLMTTPGVVDYTGMKSNRNLTGIDETLSGFHPARAGLSGLGYNIQPTPSTHTIAILPEALKSFESGTIVGAFDQAGNCFGATVYNSEIISLTVFGDDPMSAKKDGFFEGEMILFKTLTGLDETLSGLSPIFDHSLPQSKGLFAENGLSAITGFEAAAGVGNEGVFSQLNIYPNPTDGVVYLIGLEVKVAIAVTDVHGKVISHTMSSSAGLVTITLNGNKPGIYFIKIEQSGQTTFRKLVLR